jgi:hypothetical protein
MSGGISEIAFDFQAGSYQNVEFYDVVFKLCHTTLDELTATFDDNYAGNTPEVIATHNPLTINSTGGWWPIPDTTVFAYNGTDNLIIELIWVGNNGKSVYSYAMDTGATCRIVRATDYQSPTGAQWYRLHRFKLTLGASAIEASSLGRIKTLFQ